MLKNETQSKYSHIYESSLDKKSKGAHGEQNTGQPDGRIILPYET